MDPDLKVTKVERKRIQEQLQKLWSFRPEIMAITGGFNTFGLYHPDRGMERISGVPSIGVFWEMQNAEIGWFALPGERSLGFPDNRKAQEEALRDLSHGRTYNELVDYFRSVGITPQTINEMRRGTSTISL